jgi:hypothetical protein
MTQPCDNQSLDPDTLQSALEASCDALMTLQSLDRGTREPSPALGHVAQAIDSLRFAIEQLRLARDEDSSIVGMGFVVRSEPGSRRRGATPGDQVSPRRTA